MPRRFRKAAVGTAAAAVLTSAALAVASGPAEAAIGAGRVQVCAHGNYAASVQTYPSTGPEGQYLQPALVSTGGCATFTYPVGTDWIAAYGVYNTSGTKFWFPGMSVHGQGIKHQAVGTTAKPSLNILQG